MRKKRVEQKGKAAELDEELNASEADPMILPSLTAELTTPFLCILS